MEKRRTCLMVSLAAFWAASVWAAAPVHDDVLVYLDGTMANGDVVNGATSPAALMTSLQAGSVANAFAVTDDVPAAYLADGHVDAAGYANAVALTVTGTSGEGTCVAITDSSPSYTQADFTYEMFFKGRMSTGQRKIFHQPQGWRLYIDENGRLELINGGWSNTMVTTDVVADGQWHHVAVVYDTTEKTIAVYVDYALVKRVSHTIGTSPNPIAYVYGSIAGSCCDEIRLTRRTLRPAQFLRDASKCLPGVDPARTLAATDEDTVVYAGFSGVPDASWLNDMRLFDHTKPRLRVSSAYDPPEYVVPAGLSEIFPAQWADAPALTNTVAFRAYARPDQSVSTRLWGELPGTFHTGDFTYEFFFKADLASLYPVGRDTLYLLTAPGRFHLVIRNAMGDLVVWGSDWSQKAIKRDVINGTWRHVAVTWDQATRTLRFFLDGVQFGSQVRTEDFSAATSSAFGIGCFPTALGDNNFRDMTIDELRITARRLEAKELLSAARQPFYRETAAALTFEASKTANLVGSEIIAAVMNNKTSELVAIPDSEDATYACGTSSVRAASLMCYHVAKTNAEDNWNGGGLTLTDSVPALRTGSFTAETFLRIGQLSKTLDSYVFSQPGAWDLYVDAETQTLRAGAAGVGFAVSDKRVSLNRWHHLAYVYDAAAKTCTAYLDYAPIGSVSSVDVLAASDAEVKDILYYGGRTAWDWGLVNCFAEAWFDELRITRRALTVPEFLTRTVGDARGLQVIVR